MHINEVEKMTDDEIRIEIAKAHDWNSVSLGPNMPCAWEKEGEKDRINSRYLPDYPQDLNAMHEAVRDVFGYFSEEWANYYGMLALSLDDDKRDNIRYRIGRVASATARQMARAFVLTLETV